MGPPFRRTESSIGSNPIGKPISPQGSKKWHSKTHGHHLGDGANFWRYGVILYHANAVANVIPQQINCKKIV